MLTWLGWLLGLGLGRRISSLVVLGQAGNELSLVAGLGQAALAEELAQLGDFEGGVFGHCGGEGYLISRSAIADLRRDLMRARPRC